MSPFLIAVCFSLNVILCTKAVSVAVGSSQLS